MTFKVSICQDTALIIKNVQNQLNCYNLLWEKYQCAPSMFPKYGDIQDSELQSEISPQQLYV